MPHLRTQGDLRKVQRLPFCYLCAKAFHVGETTNRDHVPRSSIFESEEPAPWLATHKDCNCGRTEEEGVDGQLLGMLRDRPMHHDGNRPGLIRIQLPNGSQTAGVRFDLERTIFRWIRGFHAALYREPLPPTTRYLVFPPMHELVESGGNQVTPAPVPDVVPYLVAEIKGNRAAASRPDIKYTYPPRDWPGPKTVTVEARANCLGGATKEITLQPTETVFLIRTPVTACLSLGTVRAGSVVSARPATNPEDKITFSVFERHGIAGTLQACVNDDVPADNRGFWSFLLTVDERGVQQNFP